MSVSNQLGAPKDLSGARSIAHAAAQLLYRAAVANVAPLPGDEHSNLGWNSAALAFETHTLGATDIRVGLRLNPLSVLLQGAEFSLLGKRRDEALAWLDTKLTAAGLRPASGVDVTYDLPDDVNAIDTFADVDGLKHLAAWFDLAASSLTELAADLTSISLKPSAVRCWPHHFDIATYVSLESGDPEEARGIGVGMSPGDGSYDQPYFYVNAWPHLDPAALPPAIEPGHWHTEGFVGSIATGSEIMTIPEPQSGVATFLKHSFEANRAALGV